MKCKHDWPGGCWYCVMWCAIWHDFWCQVAIVALLQEMRVLRRRDAVYRNAEEEYGGKFRPVSTPLGYFAFWLENVTL